MTQQEVWGDPIDMSTKQGNPGETSTFDADPGTYKFKLVEIIINEGSNFEKTEHYPVAKFVWEDEEGDRFYDSFNKVPLGLRLNEKAAWTNRISALVGRPLSEADDGKCQVRFNSQFISSYDDLAEAVKDKNDSGRGAFFKADVLFEGQSVLGREALLTLGWNQKGTHMKCAAGGAAPVPGAAGGKRKKPAPAEYTPPQAQGQQQGAPSNPDELPF